jgi:hypothetical protein
MTGNAWLEDGADLGDLERADVGDQLRNLLGDASIFVKAPIRADVDNNPRLDVDNTGRLGCGHRLAKGRTAGVEMLGQLAFRGTLVANAKLPALYHSQHLIDLPGVPVVRIRAKGAASLRCVSAAILAIPV